MHDIGTVTACLKIYFNVAVGDKYKDGNSHFIKPRTPFLKSLSTVQNPQSSVSFQYLTFILNFLDGSLLICRLKFCKLSKCYKCI